MKTPGEVDKQSSLSVDGGDPSHFEVWAFLHLWYDGKWQTYHFLSDFRVNYFVCFSPANQMILIADTANSMTIEFTSKHT